MIADRKAAHIKVIHNSMDNDLKNSCQSTSSKLALFAIKIAG